MFTIDQQVSIFELSLVNGSLLSLLPQCPFQPSTHVLNTAFYSACYLRHLTAGRAPVQPYPDN